MRARQVVVSVARRSTLAATLVSWDTYSPGSGKRACIKTILIIISAVREETMFVLVKWWCSVKKTEDGA